MAYQNVQEIYARLEELCHAVADCLDDPFTFEEMKEWVDRGFSEDVTALDFDIALIPDRVMDRYPQQRYRAHISTIYAYCLDSDKSAREGDLKEAENHLARASLYCGHLDEEEATGFLVRKTSDTRSSRASGLGFAKSEKKYDPIKSELKRLLEDKKPVEGWKSKAAAIKAVQSDIAEFQEKLGRSLSPQNLPRTLAKWLSTDEGLKETFDRTKRV